jgi:hypothetical protein
MRRNNRDFPFFVDVWVDGESGFVDQMCYIAVVG